MHVQREFLISSAASDLWVCWAGRAHAAAPAIKKKWAATPMTNDQSDKTFHPSRRGFLRVAAATGAASLAPGVLIGTTATTAALAEASEPASWYSDSRCGGPLSAARACSSYSVQPWRSRLGSNRHSTTLYSLRCAAPYFWVSPARIDGPSTLYYDAPRGRETFGSYPWPLVSDVERAFIAGTYPAKRQ